MNLLPTGYNVLLKKKVIDDKSKLTQGKEIKYKLVRVGADALQEFHKTWNQFDIKQKYGGMGVEINDGAEIKSFKKDGETYVIIHFDYLLGIYDEN